MNTLFSFLGLAALVALLVGMVRPSLVRASSRRIVGRNYGLAFVVFMIGAAVTEDPAARAERAAEQLVQDSVREAEAAARAAESIREDNLVTAFVMCQQWVEGQLRAPSTAEFPSGRYREFVAEMPDSSYRVIAYVDAQNGFGAQIRTNFECITRPAGGDNWRLLDLQMD